MTPEQEGLILGLVVSPGQHSHDPTTPEELLAAFGAVDGRKLCRILLERAASESSANDVELTLVMSDAFGLDQTSLPVLQHLAHESWHHCHEDIAKLLEDLGGAEMVDDLEFLAWAGPEFQPYEGSTSLARKVVHSLERIATPETRAAVSRLRSHPESDVRALVDRIEQRTAPQLG